MDRRTLDAYERGAATYEAHREPVHGPRARALVAGLPAGSVVLDAGCGAGPYLADLLPPAGGRVVGLDLSASMLELAAARRPPAALGRADLRRLPIRTGALAAAFGRNSLVHTAAGDLPVVLAELHRALAVGGRAALSFAAARHGSREFTVEDDDLPGRTFVGWSTGEVEDLLVGAGFDEVRVEAPDDDAFSSWSEGRRARTLPDLVTSGLRLLVCGLNPSLRAADAGVGFVTPGNRFWPAALAAGLVSVDRDPLHALHHHRIGFTDLVKRATPRADELRPAEYRAGAARVERLVERLRPGAVAFVGLAGWRAAVDRQAVAGPQPRPFGGRPAYVLPSTSGLNAATPLTALVEHLRGAAALADGGATTLADR